MTNPFENTPIISQYTSEDAENDGKRSANPC